MLILAVILICTSFAAELVENSARHTRVYNLAIDDILGEPPEGTTDCESGQPVTSAVDLDGPFGEVCADVPLGSGQVARVTRIALHQTRVEAAPGKRLWSSTLTKLDSILEGKETIPDDSLCADAARTLDDPNLEGPSCDFYLSWLEEYHTRGQIPPEHFVPVAAEPNGSRPACPAMLASTLLDFGVDAQEIAVPLREWGQAQAQVTRFSFQMDSAVDDIMEYPEAVTTLLAEDVEVWRSKARWRAWSPREIYARHPILLGLALIVGGGFIAMVSFNAAEPIPLPVVCRKDGAYMVQAVDIVGAAIEFGSAIAGGIAGEVVGDFVGDFVGDTVGDAVGRTADLGVKEAGRGGGLPPLWRCPRCGSKRRQHQHFYTTFAARLAQGVGCLSVLGVLGGFFALCSGLL